jgi:hypothetical protein
LIFSFSPTNLAECECSVTSREVRHRTIQAFRALICCLFLGGH